jgi:hypothetical protein
MGEMKNSHKILSENLKGGDQLRDYALMAR